MVFPQFIKFEWAIWNYWENCYEELGLQRLWRQIYWVIDNLICIGVVLMVRNYPGGFKVKSEASGILLVTWAYWLVKGTIEYVVP